LTNGILTEEVWVEWWRVMASSMRAGVEQGDLGWSPEEGKKRGGRLGGVIEEVIDVAGENRGATV